MYDLKQELPSLLQSYELQGKQLLVSDFSRLLRHATEKSRAPTLYGKKKPGTPGGFSKFKEFPNDENVTKQKPFQRVDMEKISIRSFTELKKKKDSPTVFHLNQNVSQIIKMFVK